MTIAAVMETLAADEPCTGCGSEPARTRPVSWSPAFAQHLCADCRARRTEAELRATDQASLAARKAGRGTPAP